MQRGGREREVKEMKQKEGTAAQEARADRKTKRRQTNRAAMTRLKS
jgi:hypothetical protein